MENELGRNSDISKEATLGIHARVDDVLDQDQSSKKKKLKVVKDDILKTYFRRRTDKNC